MPKNDFQDAVRPSSWICTSCYMNQNSHLRIAVYYSSKSVYPTMFKMAAVRRLEFSKFAILVTWSVFECDSVSPSKFLFYSFHFMK